MVQGNDAVNNWAAAERRTARLDNDVAPFHALRSTFHV